MDGGASAWSSAQPHASVPQRGSGGRCRLDPIRLIDGSPLALLIGGWNAMFVYDRLVRRLPDSVSVVVAAVLPDDERDLSPVIVDIPDRADDVMAAVTREGLDLDGRPIAVVGYSRAGHVAHEVAGRMRAGGLDVRLHALVDTVFPGEEVRRPELVAAARRRKYRALVESRSYGAIARELAAKALARVRAVLRALGAAMVVWGSGEPPSLPEPPITPLDTLDYAPGTVDDDVVLYRASSSEPERTTLPWRQVVPQLVEVVVEGSHGGEESLLRTDRVSVLADDFAGRMEAMVDR
jgi:thioesterase domain-containing protein